MVTCADGSAYGAQIAWSGNHVQTIEWIDDGRRQWQLGEWLAPGEAILAPGAVLQSPDVLATASAEGPNGVAHAFHPGIRARMTWPCGAAGAAKPPLHNNTREGFYFKHDEAALLALARPSTTLRPHPIRADSGR